MSTINRAAVVVRPREPYLVWAKALDETGAAEEVWKDMREDPEVFLVRDLEATTSIKAAIRESWSTIFEEMLTGWSTEPDEWPGDRTLQMFQEWFEVEVMTMVRDLRPDLPLKYDE